MELLSEFDPGLLRGLREAGKPLWLDLTGSPPQFPEGIEAALGIEEDHEHALDQRHAGGLPELVAHEGHMAVELVAAGTGGSRGAELSIQVLLSEDFLVTAHDERVDLAPQTRSPRTPATAFARVLAVVTQSYPALITALDDEIEEVQALALDADRTVLGRVQQLRTRVLDLRRTVVAQRDAVGRAMDELLEGDPSSAEIRAVRNGYERFVRLADMLDSSRELIFAATDLYLSATSNRLSHLAERLTVFASIFLPATVLVGFFGQNFAWMTTRITSFAAFAALGLGGLLATVVISAALLRRQGYLGD